MNLGFSRKFKIQLSLAAVCIFPLFISYAASAASIVGWGEQVVGVNLSDGFIAISAGDYHSMGLKADGSIVAWGYNWAGQCNIPPPNSGFIAIAAGGAHSLGLKEDGSIIAWGSNRDGQCDIPEPNSGFIAIAAGGGPQPGP